jgi:cytochrome P450
MTITERSNIPAHVDASLVRDFDIYQASDTDGDYHAWWHDRYQGAGCPAIFWTTANGGHWVTTRGADLQHFLGKPDLYSSKVNGVPRERNFGFPLVPINMDPPEHAKYRALFVGAFSPKNVQPLGESARRLTIELIDKFHADGRCDFMTDVAYHLPISIFLKIVGVPDSHRLELLRIVEGVVRPERADDAGPFMALMEFARGVLAARRARPSDDLMSKLVTAEVEGTRLTDDQIVGAIILLLIGGLDTVASSLGFIMRYFARNADARCRLTQKINSSADSTPAIVEELFRRFPVATIVREVTADHDYNGIRLLRGDLVSNYSGAHTLDDRVFRDPMSLDLERKVPFHGGFGFGVHRCLGSMLARVELRAFMEEWFKRIPDFEVEPSAALRTRPGLVVALEHLPLAWRLP